MVLTRAAGENGDRFHDEERVLDRELWLPAARDFTVGGLAAAGPGLPDPVVDRLAGASGRVVASSSSRFFDEVGARASQALDGDPDSAWVPDGRGPGEWIELRLPGERLDHVDVLQSVPKGLVGVDAITAAEVSVNGGEPFLVNLKQGRTRVDFPKTRVRRLRLTIDRVAGLGGQVRISELTAGRARIPAAPGSRRLRGCVELARVDGDRSRCGWPAPWVTWPPVRPCPSAAATGRCGSAPATTGSGRAQAGWSTCSGCRRRPRAPGWRPCRPRPACGSPSARRPA